MSDGSLKTTPDLRVLIANLGGGGAERVCLSLCNGWVRAGLQVELLLAKAIGAYLPHLDPRVRVVDLGASRALDSFLPAARHLRAAPNIPVLIFGFEYGFGLNAAKRVGLIKTPLIYREGNSPIANVKRHLHLGYRLLISRADAVIAQSSSIKRELEALGVPGPRIRIIPNPIHSFPPERKTRKTSIRDGVLALAIGRLDQQKGFDRLIRAFKSLHENYPNSRLAILGEGASRDSLLKLAKSLRLDHAVALHGFVADPSPWYAQASLFVLSSRYEGQPNALIEAIVHGCPVLCAESPGGVVDLLNDCGLQDCLVPASEFEARFAQRVDYVMSKDPSCWQLARHQLIALAHPDKILAQYLEACGVSNVSGRRNDAN